MAKFLLHLKEKISKLRISSKYHAADSKLRTIVDVKEKNVLRKTECTCLYIHCVCGCSDIDEKLQNFDVQIDPIVYQTYSRELVSENLALIKAVSDLFQSMQNLNMSPET